MKTCLGLISLFKHIYYRFYFCSQRGKLLNILCLSYSAHEAKIARATVLPDAQY